MQHLRLPGRRRRRWSPGNPLQPRKMMLCAFLWRRGMCRLQGGLLVLGVLLVPYLLFAVLTETPPVAQQDPQQTGVTDASWQEWPGGQAQPQAQPQPQPQPQAPPYRLLNATQVEPLPPAPTGDGDDSVLMDRRDFRWLLGGRAPKECLAATDPSPAPAPLLLVLVHSAPANQEKRRWIRETWGARRPNLALRFLFGTTDAHHQQVLDSEQQAHGDLVQGSFLDAYRNLTYKHVMALKFAATLCPAATYVLKTDDDVMVNMPAMMDFLRRELSPYGARDLLMCETMFTSAVKRSYRSKWRVSYAEYQGTMYPPYCPGYAVLYSPDVVARLYRESARVPFFWIDDVLVTGVMAKRLGVRPASWESLVLKEEEVPRVISGEERVFLLAPVHLSPERAKELWDHIMSASGASLSRTASRANLASPTTPSTPASV